jgi:hypothetical protein
VPGRRSSLGEFHRGFSLSNTLSYDPDFVIHTGYDAITVWNDAAGQDFVQAISLALQNMHEDGTIEALLGKRYIPYSYQPTHNYQWQAQSVPANNK